MKKLFSWRILWMGMLWLSGPLLLSAIIYPVFQRAAENQNPVSCQGNLKLIALGVFQYTQDYDKRYPIARVNDTSVTTQNPYGWADALQPYLKRTQLYQCPSEVTSSTIATSGTFNGQADPTEKGYTDYWYNPSLNGLEQKDIRFLASTLMFGDGSDGTDASDARYNASKIPQAWKPSRRHLDGANYCFADGHVKWLKPEAITTKKPDGKNATFAVR